MKKISKNIISTLFLLSVSSVSLAYSAKASLNPDPDSSKLGSGVTTSVESIIGTVKWIAVVVAVVMVIYVGIKYLTAGAGTKADVKGNLIPMMIGAIIISSAAVIVEAVFNMVS